MPKRGFPPVCILLSDGYCTDPQSDYIDAINALQSEPWGKKAICLSIAIGSESDYDEEELLRFVSPGLRGEVGVLKAKSPEQLLHYIRWASVAASVSSSEGKSRNNDTTANDQPPSNVVLGKPPILGDCTDIF